MPDNEKRQKALQVLAAYEEAAKQADRTEQYKQERGDQKTTDTNRAHTPDGTR